jgi:hypothetical protein
MSTGLLASFPGAQAANLSLRNANPSGAAWTADVARASRPQPGGSLSLPQKRGPDRLTTGAERSATHALRPRGQDARATAGETPALRRDVRTPDGDPEGLCQPGLYGVNLQAH